MRLFDNKKRVLEGPADYNSDPYFYYNNSARDDIANIRNVFEDWFEKYPEDEKEEMKSRFKVSFYPTLYELYIFTLFTKLGYTLEIHPEIPDTEKRPDFIARRGDSFFYIEVKYMTMLSKSEEGLENRKNLLFDSLNKINSTNFLIKLEKVFLKDSGQPSAKRIISYFNNTLSSIDPDAYEELLKKNGYEGISPIVYENERILLECKLIPKTKHLRGLQTRTLASFPYEFKIGNDSSDIKEYLKAKATRYGRLNAPYIICLNKQCVGLDIWEIQQALYGSLAISWSNNPLNRDEKLSFGTDGFFGSKSNPQFTRLSGVYITNANDANLATTGEHVFRHNPFAEYPISFRIDQKIRDILNIPDNYPYNS